MQSLYTVQMSIVLPMPGLGCRVCTDVLPMPGLECRVFTLYRCPANARTRVHACTLYSVQCILMSCNVSYTICLNAIGHLGCYIIYMSCMPCFLVWTVECHGTKQPDLGTRENSCDNLTQYQGQKMVACHQKLCSNFILTPSCEPVSYFSVAQKSKYVCCRVVVLSRFAKLRNCRIASQLALQTINEMCTVGLLVQMLRVRVRVLAWTEPQCC